MKIDWSTYVSEQILWAERLMAIAEETDGPERDELFMGIIYRSHNFLLRPTPSRVTTESQFREAETWQARHRGRLTARVSH